MVNTLSSSRSSSGLGRITAIVTLYVLVAFATVAALAVLSATDSDQATPDAWVHAVLVGFFAAVLPLRLRAARRGSRRAVLAVGLIATVLMVVNVVEALIPGLFPAWMRVEMVGIAVLMAIVAGSVLRERR